MRSDEENGKMLVRLMSYLKNTTEIELCLEADDVQELRWCVDASFGTHNDMKSHTRFAFTLGKQAIWKGSTKQKVNAWSSTEDEFISIDDMISKIIWVKRCIESQGFKIDLKILYQDNMSTIKLAENRKHSSGKKTILFGTKYFYIIDLLSLREVSIVDCSSNSMAADYHTKS